MRGKMDSKRVYILLAVLCIFAAIISGAILSRSGGVVQIIVMALWLFYAVLNARKALLPDKDKND